MTMNSRSAFLLCAANSGLIAFILLTGLSGALVGGGPGQYVAGGMVLAGEPITDPDGFEITIEIDSLPSGWTLPYPGETDQNEVTLKIRSTGIWQLSASDENPDTGGRMTKYHTISDYYDTSTKLENYLVVSCTAWERTLPGGGVILFGNSTLEYPDEMLYVDVALKQKATWNDVVLPQDWAYQIEVTFKGEACI